jgi:hypothetical protein
LDSEARVVLVRGTSVRGFSQAAAADSLTLRTRNGQEQFSRAEIKSVQLKGKGHHGRNALIGLGVGAAAGLAIGASADRASAGDFANLGKAVFTPLGGIIGAVVGVLIPSGGWREIYRAP